MLNKLFAIKDLGGEVRNLLVAECVANRQAKEIKRPSASATTSRKLGALAAVTGECLLAPAVRANQEGCQDSPDFAPGGLVLQGLSLPISFT